MFNSLRGFCENAPTFEMSEIDRVQYAASHVLTPVQQQVFSLRYLRGWTLRQIAEDTGRDPSTVCRCAARGIKTINARVIYKL